jgi:ribosomal protein S12 methylthiotransferase accessory factor
MHFRNIDRTSSDGLHALGLLEAHHGPALADAARGMERLFLLGSPLAPGLWFVGGQTSSAHHGTAGVFSVAGTGLSFADALASCCGEAIERVALVEQPTDVVATGPLGDQMLMGIRPLAERLLADKALPLDTPIDWVRGQSFVDGREVSLPADWCLRRGTPGALSIPGLALSTGSAAGRTADDAITRALLELIERDAAALWWLGGRPARLVSLDDPAMAAPLALIGTLRQNARGRRMQLLDITTDVNMPVVAALSSADDGSAFACGLGCRMTLAAAASAAIMEMCQTEIGLQFALEKRAQLGDAALTDGDRRHIARGEGVTASSAAVYSAPAQPSPHLPGATDLQILQRALTTAGITAAQINLTRGSTAVYKTVAPQLQLYPGEMLSTRLTQTRAGFGGATHWTGDLPLF